VLLGVLCQAFPVSAVDGHSPESIGGSPMTTIGDLNQDGKIDALDVHLLGDFLAGNSNSLPVDPFRADMDADGTITAVDLTRLLLKAHGIVDYRFEMRQFVTDISSYGKSSVPGFVIIPQNGHELLTLNGEHDGPIAAGYMAAIDGAGQEDLLYGYDGDNVPTPAAETAYMAGYLDLAESHGVEALVTDYCWTPAYVDDSYAGNAAAGYISFAANRRDLDAVPPYPAGPYNEDASDIENLSQAKNFLYLINPGAFGDDREAFLNAIRATNYDAVIMDLFFNDNTSLTLSEVASLKLKANGGRRLVICYMSIGEAEDYRYYWQPEWSADPPEWLGEENPNWPGNYKVRYWMPGWQAIITGNEDAYLRKIIDAGFDGVYLDIIDAFWYFEN